jgi:hypothetical protein
MTDDLRKLAEAATVAKENGDEWVAIHPDTLLAITAKTPGMVCVPVEPSDDEIEACAIAIFDHWQGSGHAHSQTWEDRDKKLPGSTAFFRTIARKGLTASRAMLAAHGGKE